MSNDFAGKQIIANRKTERSTHRWLMMIYDSVFYVACWLIILILYPSVEKQMDPGSMILYPIIGYLLFFGFRFIFKCYKQILRYGSALVFSREIIAGALAALVFWGLNMLMEKVFHLADIPLALLVLFSSANIVVSLVMRVFYCSLFKFAEKKTASARFVRRILEVFARVDFSSKQPGATLPLTKHVPLSINELQHIIDQFAICGEMTDIVQINKGYINRTYRVETLSEAGHVHKYTLQRINTNVFPDVDALMDNFKLTTDHLYDRLLLPGYHKRGSVPMIRETKDGKSYLADVSGCWRMLTHFDDVYSMDIPERPKTFYYAGSAFGNFMKEMSDVPVSAVKEVIPNFHNTKSRYQDLEAAIAKDPKGRVKDVMPEIEFVRERADQFGIISDALESGRIPTRICHNDSNLNNILFDCETHLPVAIIDLDTVMPSSPLYDYGDSMRIGTNTALDDEKDLSKVSCNLDLYEQYARGYLEACGDILTKAELELLPYAALIITAEDGIRFLMDHINGDTYYTIYYPGQNLDRSRTQLKLLEDMERKLPEIKKILRRIYAELGLKAKI